MVAYAGLAPEVRAFVDRQYRAAYGLVAAARHPGTGAYLDSCRWTPSPQAAMCSVAAVGVGLIALCLGDLEGWEPEAAAQAVQTLRGMTGRLSAFDPAREATTGFFRHFIDVRSGAAWPGAEFSTIDTALLVAGALCAKRHFRAARHPLATEVGALAEELFTTVAWARAVAAPVGTLYMVVEPGGQGSVPAHPFNEYALLAWLLRRAHTAGDALAEPWDAVFRPEALGRLPHAVYDGVAVLIDDPAGRAFLSSFVPQFPFYLVHAYTESSAYRAELAAAAAADRRYWRRQPGVADHVWGLGAGAALDGYHADAIERCPDGIASPHIVAGFLPVYPEGIHDLHRLWVARRCSDGAAASDETGPGGQAWGAGGRGGEGGDRAPDHAAGTDLSANRGVGEAAGEAGAGGRGAAGAMPEAFPLWREGPGASLQRYVASDGSGSGPPRWTPPFCPLVDWSGMLYGLAAFRRGVGIFARMNDWNG